jgi:putative transposase
VLVTFYDFPAEHWKHLRTTNPIESTFATVRHRTVRSKGCLSNRTALAMVFKFVEAPQKSWRRLDGYRFPGGPESSSKKGMSSNTSITR